MVDIEQTIKNIKDLGESLIKDETKLEIALVPQKKENINNKEWISYYQNEPIIQIPRKGDIELAKGIRQDLEDVLTEAELLELDKIAAFKDVPLRNIEVIIAALEQYVEK